MIYVTCILKCQERHTQTSKSLMHVADLGMLLLTLDAKQTSNSKCVPYIHYSIIAKFKSVRPGKDLFKEQAPASVVHEFKENNILIGR